MYGIGGLASWYYDKIDDDLHSYLNELRDVKSKEGEFEAWKTMMGDTGTLAKNVLTTLPDVFGNISKIPTRALGYEYTPWDPGGYAQLARENEISPGGVAGILPWAYSKLGGIPQYTYRGMDETGGLGPATKIQIGGLLEGMTGKDGPYTKTQEKMGVHADDLLDYYLGDGKETFVGDTLPYKDYATKNWTSSMTSGAVKDYDKQFSEDDTWTLFLDELDAVNEKGDTEFVQHAYNNLQEYYDHFKKADKESFIQNKMVDKLLPGYLEEAGGKYRKELLDEYGMYPLGLADGADKIDFGRGADFYLADPKFVDQKSKKGKTDHMMAPDEFDHGVFKGFVGTDWAPYSYSSDKAMRLFENPYVRLPAELPAWAIAGPTQMGKMANVALPKSLSWGVKQTMPGSFGHEGIKRFKYLPRNWRHYAQLPLVLGATEYQSERGDKFIREGVNRRGG